MQKSFAATTKTVDEVSAKLDSMRKALKLAERPDDAVEPKLVAMADKLTVLKRKLNGDGILAARNENVPDSIGERIRYAAGTHDDAIVKPTGTAAESMKVGTEELAEVNKSLKELMDVMPELVKRLDELGVPWTPGRSVK